MCVCVCLARVQVAEDDWAKDARGKKRMEFSDFFAALFEIVDVWTVGINEKEYIRFLALLYGRLTTWKRR